MGGKEGTYVEGPASDHGAQRLSGGNLLHLLLQSDPGRRRHRRRHLLRQHRRHAARDRRAAAGAVARTRRHDCRSPHMAAGLRAKRACARHQSPRFAVRHDLHARTGRTSATLASTSNVDRDHPAVMDNVAARSRRTLGRLQPSRKTTGPGMVSGSGDGIPSMFPSGAWQQAPNSAVVLPIMPSGETGRAGILIAGLNPFRLFDDDYAGFIESGRRPDRRGDRQRRSL